MIHLINKKPHLYSEVGDLTAQVDEKAQVLLRQATKFSKDDLDNIEKLSYAIARCAEQIYKIE